MAPNPAGTRRIRVAVIFPGPDSEIVGAAQRVVQGLAGVVRSLRRCRSFVHSPQQNASVALSAVITAVNQGHELVRVWEEQGLQGVNPNIWAWPIHSSFPTLSGIRKLRGEKAVDNEGEAILEAVGRLAERARGNGEDLIIAVSHVWPVSAAIMLVASRFGKETYVANRSIRDAVVFGFEDEELVEVTVFTPEDDDSFKVLKVFRAPRPEGTEPEGRHWEG